MFTLTDEIIDNAIGNISGYIVTTVSKKLDCPAADISEAFSESDIYALLQDKETGYYWDSMSEIIDKFINEIIPVN